MSSVTNMRVYAARLAGALASVVASALVLPAGAQASTEPIGIWLDHTGRGAVEISNCGANLCGRLVWLKDAKNSKGCGLQIIGDAKPMGTSTWGGGWIYDPDEDARYSVELTPQGDEKLRVVGYLGSKLFSETMIWKRAPTDLKRCDGQDTLAAVPAPSDKATAVPETKASGATAPGQDTSDQTSTDAAKSANASPDIGTEPKAGASQPPPEPPAKAPQRAKRAQDCKLEFASVVVRFPCP